MRKKSSTFNNNFEEKEKDEEDKGTINRMKDKMRRLRVVVRSC